MFNASLHVYWFYRICDQCRSASASASGSESKLVTSEIIMNLKANRDPDLKAQMFRAI